MQEFFTGIATVGFPAACCAFLLWQGSKFLEAMRQEIAELRKTVQQNTEVTNELLEFLKK